MKYQFDIAKGLSKVLEKDLQIIRFIKSLTKFQLDTEVSYYTQILEEDDSNDAYDFKSRPYSSMKRPSFKIKNMIKTKTVN